MLVLINSVVVTIPAPYNVLNSKQQVGSTVFSVALCFGLLSMAEIKLIEKDKISNMKSN